MGLISRRQALLSSVLALPAERSAEVSFEFGEPYLLVSVKTGASGIYAPHAFRASSGPIFLGYYTYPDDFGPEPFPAALLRSTDNGLTWRSLGERGNFGYMFGERPDGSVLAVDCQGNVDSDGQYASTVQEFGAKGTAAPRFSKIRVHGFRKGEEPYFHLTRMVRAKDGSLVTAAYSPADGSTREMWYTNKPSAKPTRIVCLSSIDDGRSWKFLSNVALDETNRAREHRNIGLSEPFVEALPDGRLLCIYRDDRRQTGNEYRLMKQCWSADSGATWTQPVSSGVAGVDPCLLQMQNGVLLCSFGGPGVWLMYSLNGGVHWEGHTSIYSPTSPPPRDVAPAALRRPWSHAYTSMVALSEESGLFFFDIHEHRMPWTGRLPAAEAGPEHRANSIFAVPFRVIRKKR